MMESQQQHVIIIVIVAMTLAVYCDYMPQPCHQHLYDKTMLDCSRQNLTGIPKHLPAERNTITALWLNGNNITVVNQDLMENFHQLRVLWLESNMIKQLTSHAFAKVPYLQHLHLQDNEIQSLNNDVFWGMHNLEILDIRKNPLDELPDKTFEELKNLQELQLSMCYLPELLSHDLLFGLENLQNLTLEFCNISLIQREVFGKVPNLKRLSLKGNRLQTIDSVIFHSLSKLEFLDLSGNLLTQIPQQLCDYMPRLVDISFSFNPLHEIKFGEEFQKCRLENIHLVSVKNRGTVLRNDSFIGIAGSPLNKLDFRENNASYLHYEVFSVFTNLSSLDLSLLQVDLFTATRAWMTTVGDKGSKVHTLRASNNSLNSFFPMVQSSLIVDFLTEPVNRSFLKELDISRNQLSELENNTFVDFSSLEVLDISHNLITHIEVAAFSGLYNLLKLSLKDNNLWTIIPQTFNVQPNFPLTSLDLSENVISYWQEKAFTGLKNLRTLNLGDQGKIRILPQNFDDLPSLEELDIFGNTWSDQFHLPLCKMKNLTFLNISQAWVHSKYVFPLDDMSVKCPGYVSPLKKLDFKASFVDNCKCVENYFSRNWRAFQNLERLFISFMIHYDPDYFPWKIFTKLSKLKVLKLKGNHIEKIPPDIFANCTNLTYLDLSLNTIASLDSIPCNGLHNLETLDLQQNAITTIDSKFFEQLPKLKKLNLNGNKYDCSCSFKSTDEFLTSSKAKSMISLTSNSHHFDERPYWFQDYACDTPDRLRGKTIADFNPYNTLLCEPSIIFTIMLVLFIFLVTVSVLLERIFRYEIRYLWFTTKLKFNCQQYEPLVDDHTYEYDVNISNSDEDNEWVATNLLPYLETTLHLRVHFKERDMKPGTRKPRYIADLIYKNSRKTLFVVSESFVANGMCMQELYTAFQKLFDNHMNVMVFVNLDKIPDKKRPRILRFPLCQKRVNKWWECTSNERRKKVFWETLKQHISEGSHVNHITQIH
ncbi:insulin-like growth factor-binding protein complex acid labile subunit [Ptychodera flava]|uniref:insulin-like growth factor-binding protein complex acid labile subunit n=1 Tax=Ptychodera flava TaxID=63121 RepID=UPI00396A4310